MLPRRLLFAFIALLLSIGSPAFAQTRAAPSNDAFNSRLPLPRNSAGTIATLNDAVAHETNEPVPTCAIDGNDIDSVWFRMDLPDGKLTFTAVGTGFAPVITLYESEGPITNLLPETACATSVLLTPTVTTILTKTVVSGRYIVRVANDRTTVLGMQTLNYTFTFAPPTGISIPSNDSVETAKQVVFNKIMKTNNVEYSTFNATDPNQTCVAGPMYHSVWYTFSLEEDNVDVTFATEGSIYNEAQNTVNGARFMLFEETSPGVLAPMNCVSSGGLGNAANATIQLDAGTYKIALFGVNSSGLDGPSLARLLVIPENISVLTNTSFDTALSPWKVKNKTGDGIVTGAESLDGSSFKFTGGPGEKSKLVQTIVPNGYIIMPDSLLTLTHSFKHVALMNKGLTFEIKLTLSNGSTRSLKGKFFLPSVGGFGVDGDQFVLTDKGIVKIQLTITNTSTTGIFVLDGITIQITPLGYGLRDGVLPLPPPAQ